MNDGQNRISTGKAIALVVLVAVVTAVVITLAQVLIRGHSNTAMTGGVAGAVAARTAISATRRKAS
jgi:hypothetical protein